MRPVHYISIAVAIALIALLYWGGNTVPPKDKQVAEMQRPSSGGAVSQAPNTMRVATFNEILASARKQLSATAADTVATIEKEISAMRDSSRMAVSFYSLSGVWERAHLLPVAAYYRAAAAKLENSQKNLTFAGQLFLELLEQEENRAVQMWEATEAIACAQQVLKAEPDNEEAKLVMASAYIQGTSEPMTGVQMALGIAREKPDNVPANMLLGRMSIQSGQFDKAVKRFETVLAKEPENKEALYFLAQAYEGTGNKTKAIELLQKCKMVVNNPDFSREIDEHIKTLK
ncbi:MAG: tetratricopeptide repeat protein [Taibaiella sp.]|nr:tetratricopeptide repeat protein [Taibaiella sp.]